MNEIGAAFTPESDLRPASPEQEPNVPSPQPTASSREENMLETHTSCAPLECGAATVTHLLARYTALVKEDPHVYRAAESLLSSLSYLTTNRSYFGYFVCVRCHVQYISNV